MLCLPGLFGTISSPVCQGGAISIIKRLQRWVLSRIALLHWAGELGFCPQLFKLIYRPFQLLLFYWWPAQPTNPSSPCSAALVSPSLQQWAL